MSQIPVDDRQDLERITLELADHIRQGLPPTVGFTLFIFSYRAGGWMTYLSTANRAEMIAELKAFIAREEDKS